MHGALLIKNRDNFTLVSETHFTEQNYVNIPNYVTTNHPDVRTHAGSATIIRKHIKHHELRKYETDYIQATNISIEDWAGNLAISAIYCPPRHKIKTEQYNAFIGHRFQCTRHNSFTSQYLMNIDMYSGLCRLCIINCGEKKTF
jgi:hypothetical protein